MGNPTLREGMQSADGWVEYLHDLLNGHFYGRTDFKFYKSGEGLFDADDEEGGRAVPARRGLQRSRRRRCRRRQDVVGARRATTSLPRPAPTATTPVRTSITASTCASTPT